MTKKLVLWFLGPLIISATPVLVVIIVVVVFAAAMIASNNPGLGSVQISNAAASNTNTVTTWRGEQNATVVSAARLLASKTYNGPPDGYTTWYSGMPQAVLDYWNAICRGCSEWANGNLQCTFFVAGAYFLAGQPLPLPIHNAVDWWGDYWRAVPPGWDTIAYGNMPLPGDILILDSGTLFDGAGHVAVITDVKLPSASQAGYIQWAQGNAQEAITQLPLNQQGAQLTFHIWTGYTVLGYIRHTAVEK